MSGLTTQAGAMQLLKEAKLRPTATTLHRIEDSYNLGLNANVEAGKMDASKGSVIVRAYVEMTLEPSTIKCTETRAETHFECYICGSMNFETAATASCDIIGE